MARYIDADALYEDIIELWISKPFGIVALNEVKERIDNQPTADVVERKKGEWKKHNERSCWYCSECKADNYYAYNWDTDTGEFEFQDNYCPNCGADLRKEVES